MDSESYTQSKDMMILRCGRIIDQKTVNSSHLSTIDSHRSQSLALSRAIMKKVRDLGKMRLA